MCVVALVGTVLAGLGWWSPPVGFAAAALAVAIAVATARHTVPPAPAPSRTAEPASGPEIASWWPAVLVVLAATMWLAATHTEQVVPRRDAGSTAQATALLAREHARTVALDPADFGGPAVLETPGVTLAAPGFYSVGTPAEPRIEPQFLTAVPVLLTLGWWIGGYAVAALLPPLALGLTLLGTAVLTGRLTSPRWGAAAAGLGALAYPLVYVGRTTFSEVFALLPLVAAALLLQRAARELSVMAGAVAGALVGATVLVRIDGVREAALVALGLGWVLGASALDRRWAGSALIATVTCAVVGLLCARWLSGGYLDLIESSVRPAVLLLLGCTALGPVLGLVTSGLVLPSRLRRSAPRIVAAAVVGVLLVLASRPLWWVARQAPDGFGVDFVASLQRQQSLPVDGARTYVESTVTWLSWYLGPVALVVTTAVVGWAASEITRRWLDRGRPPTWFVVALVGLDSSVLTLLRPGITPDHPWADRRMVIPVVVVVVLTILGVASWWRRGGRRRVAAGVAAVVTVVWAGAATAPFALGGQERGSVRAVKQVCASLGAGDVVVAADDRAANEWPQVVRGWCGIPALALEEAVRRDPEQRAGALADLASRVSAGERRLVVLTTEPERGGDLVTESAVRQDPSRLTSPPRFTLGLTYAVWLTRR